MADNKQFPLFFESLNGNIQYKISSERTLEEVQKLGRKYFYFKVDATQYPDIMSIANIISGGRKDLIPKDSADGFVDFFKRYQSG